ncbi:hypothetical protein EMPG_14039 [Blastomyces silverae]|uniref:Uncharacterized protein n=1 Tax=Blastomyces silverae TaxID=2060906 RepID=A0A0H1BGF1_9EURO|nr:hypothetical protein EMPG_14039 [Blastomyces silverae]
MSKRPAISLVFQASWPITYALVRRLFVTLPIWNSPIRVYCLVFSPTNIATHHYSPPKDLAFNTYPS